MAGMSIQRSLPVSLASCTTYSHAAPAPWPLKSRFWFCVGSVRSDQFATALWFVSSQSMNRIAEYFEIKSLNGVVNVLSDAYVGRSSLMLVTPVFSAPVDVRFVLAKLRNGLELLVEVRLTS